MSNKKQEIYLIQRLANFDLLENENNFRLHSISPPFWMSMFAFLKTHSALKTIHELFFRC